MDTSRSHGLLFFSSGDSSSQRSISVANSRAPMLASSIPAVSRKDSDKGWLAAVIQIARHCDNANRTSARTENARMDSGTILTRWLLCQPRHSPSMEHKYQCKEDSWMAKYNHATI